jgi:ubiquinone/menaquinone biosynthesis C-methylase UbiE
MFHPKGPTFLELAQQALSSTERGYDLLAPKFDYTPFRTPDVILDAVADHLRADAPFGAGLDLCCGTGAAMRMLRPLCRERVVGIDFSLGMLAVARQRTEDAPGRASLEFVRGNVLSMPFERTFDVAVSFGAFGHILRKDESRFVREIARVLKPGGRFVFATLHLASLGSLERWASRAFNVAMRIRNFLVSPPFIMYYLTFLLPDVKTLLERHGFDVQETPLDLSGHDPRFRLVTAVRRG